MKFHVSLASVLALAGLACCQNAPNTVAQLYPNYQTQAPSGVFVLIPIDTSAAQKLAGNYKLIQAPNFAAGTHPALIYTVFSNDIRQNALAIPSLKVSQIIIPYIDRLGDGTTAFARTVQGFLGGTNGNRLRGVVPALVGTAQSAGGYPLFTAIIDPDDSPYESTNGRQFYANTKLDVLPNDLSGPGVTPSAIDILFQFSTAQYGFNQVNSALNQPAILPTGQCQRNNWRFNETFADVRPVSGTVRLYGPVVPGALSGSSVPLTPSSKTYTGSGYSGNGQLIGFPAEDCATAARKVIVV